MNEVSIRSCARIHTALLNESGYLGRIDGSIGFSIKKPSWEITLSRNELNFDTSNVDAEIIKVLETFKSKLTSQYDLPNFSYSLPKIIESHIGLGSKTSLLMGFGEACSKLFKLNIPPEKIALLAQRGGTSGIGYWSSQIGGFLWDSGRKYPSEKSTFTPSFYSHNAPPYLLSSISIDTFIICHFRFSNNKIHGEKEMEIFKNNCPLSHASTKEMLAILAGSLIPSLIDSCNIGIQKSLSTIQKSGMKKIEWMNQDIETLRFKEYWESLNTGVALCLSSMGPTMYCLTATPIRIKNIIEAYDRAPLHYNETKIYNGKKK